jgi:uncharacterized membrane protein YhaH (DUF805 family)
MSNIVWLLFSFNGRLGRLGFFTAWLGLSLAGGVVQMATMGQATGDPVHPPAQPPDVALLFIRAALLCVLAWGQIAIQAKRFHDFNWSGWWVLAPGAAGLGLIALWLGGLVSLSGGGSEGGAAFVGLGLLTIGVLLFFALVGLMLLFRGGTAGPNVYGPRSGPPEVESRPADWAQRILDDPLAAAERLRERENRAVRASAEPAPRAAPAPAAAAPSGERVFGRRNVRA